MVGDMFSRLKDVDLDRAYPNKTDREEGCMQSLPSSWSSLGTAGSGACMLIPQKLLPSSCANVNA